MPDNTHIPVRLTLDVTYELNGTPIHALCDRLQDLLQRAIGDGMLTGDTEATVDEYATDVSIATADNLREEARRLLERATAIDGKRPYLLICAGGLDQPEAGIVWETREPSEVEAAEAMNLTADDLGNSNSGMTVMALALCQLVPAPEAGGDAELDDAFFQSAVMTPAGGNVLEAVAAKG